MKSEDDQKQKTTQDSTAEFEKYNLELEFQNLRLAEGDVAIISVPKEFFREREYIERLTKQIEMVKDHLGIKNEFIYFPNEIDIQSIRLESGDSLIIKIPEECYKDPKYLEGVTQTAGMLKEKFLRDNKNIEMWVTPKSWGFDDICERNEIK